MPELPAFIADFLVPRFAHPAVVQEVEVLAPQLRRVRFSGPALMGLHFQPGQEVKFRVTERSLRHYTPSAYDPVAGTLDVIFYLHGKGPGSDWAQQLQVGAPTQVLGPSGRGVLQKARTHVLLGDETALGLFHSFSASTRGQLMGAVEVDPGCERWPELAQVPGVQAVTRQEKRGEALISWIHQHSPQVAQDVVFYLIGHTDSILRLREKLLQAGWERRQLVSRPYWADGKRGL